MTPREPDRFDAQARELVAQHYGPALSRESVPWIAAALRAEHASALERAAQEYGSDDLADVKVYCRHVAQRLRALIPPAAAPAADYDPITAPIPEGDMNGPHGPLPAAETRNDPCQRCGKLGGHPVDFRFDGISMSSWICPHCLVVQEKRLAGLETALVKIRDGCGYGLGHDIPWVRDVAKSALAARAARPEGPK